MGAVLSERELRPGIAVPRDQRDALWRLISLPPNAAETGRENGDPDTRAVLEHSYGVHDRATWQGAVAYPIEGDSRTVVYEWRTERRHPTPPIHLPRYAGCTAVFQVYPGDFDVRLVRATMRDDETGPRPEDIAEAYDGLRQFWQRGVTGQPPNTEAARDVAARLHHPVLQQMAQRMIAHAGAVA
jgi:hypothetical protein